MIKDDAINIIKNYDFNKKRDCYKIFSLYIKMSETRIEIEIIICLKKKDKD